MHELDHAVKVVCALSPNCFLDLFYGSGRKVVLKSVEDAQIQIPEHRADKVWRVHDGVREGCIALEAIAVPDRRDFRSINLKNAALQVNLNVPVITVLVYLERGKYATFPEGYEDELGGLTNAHRFARVLLWEHEERIRSGELKELSPFLLLFYTAPDPRILEVENQLIETVEDPEQRLELKSIGAIIAARYFSEEIIKQYLKLEFPMIRETNVFKEWFDQSRAEGRAEGRVEGLVEGEISGKRLLLQKQLEKKFGLLSQEVKERLQKLNSEQLDALATILFDLATAEDLRAWLTQTAASSHLN
jgi:predicted transposase YdaD